MGKYTGRDVKIGIAKESSRGVPNTATYFIPRKDFDIADKTIIIIDEQGYGVIEDSVDVKVVNKYAEGKIGGLVRDKAIGLFLLNALGASSPSSSSPAAGCYTHVFTVSQSHNHQSLSIFVDDPTEGDLAYPLAMLKSLEIVAGLNEFVIFNADFLASAGISTPVSATYAVENVFSAEGIEAYFAGTLNELNAATKTKIKSATIKIEKNIEKDDILGSLTPDDFINKSFSVEVDIEKNFEDTTFKTIFTTGTPQAMRLKIVSGSLIGTALGTYPTITVNLNQVKITDWSVAKDLDGINTESFTVKANYKIADAKMLDIRLINTVASY